MVRSWSAMLFFHRKGECEAFGSALTLRPLFSIVARGQAVS